MTDRKKGGATVKNRDELALKWQKFCEGENSALEEIMESVSDSLLYFVLRLVKNIWCAEDIVADTFAGLILSKKKFRGDSSFKTYLFSAARHRAIDYIRKHAREIPSEIDERSLVDCETLEARLIESERHAHLHIAMNELTEKYRQVLYLVYFEELSAEESAKIMKLSRKQTENLIFRARRALKTILEKDGYDYENL